MFWERRLAGLAKTVHALVQTLAICQTTNTGEKTNLVVGRGGGSPRFSQEHMLKASAPGKEAQNGIEMTNIPLPWETTHSLFFTNRVLHSLARFAAHQTHTDTDSQHTRVAQVIAMPTAQRRPEKRTHGCDYTFKATLACTVPWCGLGTDDLTVILLATHTHTLLKKLYY